MKTVAKLIKGVMVRVIVS